MDKRVKRGLRAARPKYQDGGSLPFVSIPPDDLAKAQADPQRYERFFEPIAAGVKTLGDLVRAPFDMARDARQAGGYSQLNPADVGRAGLNTGLGTLMPAVGGVGGRGGAVLMSGAGPTDKGIRAYHGSPHDFDKFDMSKIGSGEGAQAYGHGLYFAENEGVAGSYRTALSRAHGGWKFDGKPLEKPEDFWSLQKQLEDVEGNWRLNKLVNEFYSLRRQGYSKDEALKNRRDWHRGDPEMQAAIEEFAKRSDMTEIPGRMYEVRIDADPEDFLDWDKPLSQQSEKVRGALEGLGVATKNSGEWSVTPSKSGNGWTVRNVWGEPVGTFKTKEAAEAKAAANTTRHNTGNAQLAYQRLGGNAVYSNLDQGVASAKLRKAGIPGIKYLDQGSRAAGEGSRNYVLFRDDIINIVRKYGMAAAVSMYGADAVNNALQPMATGNDG